MEVINKPYYLILQDRILEHRYRYYRLDHPVISDMEYDFLEKLYESECKKANVESILKEHGVDFKDDHPEFIAAKERVETRTDEFSLWELQMKPIWDKIGYPRYLK